MRLMKYNVSKRKYLSNALMFTYRYWRVSKWDTVLGIGPVKKLLERSSVRSFDSFPISVGMCPDILLF